MSKILVLAPTGFGKSTSIGCIPELGIQGLDPTKTYLFSCVNKPLPFRGAKSKYGITVPGRIAEGNRIITNDAKVIAECINLLIGSPYENIVIDDMNYISQDHYMKNALKGGWDVPKQIGYNMGLIFDAINNIPEDKNIICLAHYEEYKDKNGDSLSYRYKSTGNMVDAYITPEGKFEIVLFGRTYFDDKEKRAVKEFVTNNDGQFPAKSPVGMFKDLYIPNDLGYVVKEAKAFNDEEG